MKYKIIDMLAAGKCVDTITAILAWALLWSISAHREFSDTPTYWGVLTADTVLFMLLSASIIALFAKHRSITKIISRISNNDSVKFEVVQPWLSR
ncbi:hypothetical protein [Muribaculum caecicola]|uniref:Uncharacterized protein n=1 Tax=Muribaculum caecicola TaxID=3038144 RepID=A0AC61S285_9BACT|nr:hypothetical protein [Muribaculum caecicola]THG39246.1 hypothetical protein E5990_11275 [Muribaculum caecicola]